MNVSETLNLAADVLQTRGWTSIDGEWDESPWGGGDNTGPVCIEGAIGAALGIDMRGSDSRVVVCPAYAAMHEYVRDRVLEVFPQYGDTHFPLFTYNDSVAESGEEVIEALRACAVIEEAKERAAQKESVLA